MIVLGLSGLPNSRRKLHEGNPDIDPLDARICQGLDSAAAIIVDGSLVAAASEERFDGDKGTGALPRQAIAWCLAEAGVTADDVDVVAHGFDYDRHRRAFALNRTHFDEVLSSQTVRDALTDAGWPQLAAVLTPVEHHRAHALSATVPSGFDRGLAVVSDGMGEVDSLTIFRFVGTELEKLHTQPIAASLGILYSIGTRFLGFQFNNDEYKVMGLAPYGDPSRYRGVFQKLTRFDHDKGSVVIDWPSGALADAERGYPRARALLEEQTFTPAVPDGSIQRDEADFAASMQECLTDLLVSLVGHWLERTGETNLALAGGTFLNCKSNQSIADLPGVQRLFVQPASGDDGSSLGAAYAVAEDLRPVATPFDPYLGARYSADEVRAVLEARPDLRWREVGLTEEYLAAAADDIADDRIIAVFHDRMEFGPRALGNRSILARPDGDRIKDRINSAVKFREAFRPFAPAVHVDDRDRLFVTRGFEPDHYMLCTAHVRPEAKPALSGIVHEDDSARIQTVTPGLNPTFASLLEKVRDRTGTGCVVNTSFNVKGQPLIMDPATAVDTFARIALDRLYIEGFVVEGTQR
ncbi:carbamoyltransferase C-terminal domain-containing protein [Actinomycetospora sp. OC33-EN08]|uniref:Carbamoyltransferase C-terminal domain-containing protein n=1 Tax=Actinomycetospora aurantiaca TaxID=3129233 RepID=A0ABU8MQ47_9PSEU